MNLTLSELLVEYDRAVAWTDSLWTDLSPAQVAWRPEPDSSAIGWHLGHQAAVAHHPRFVISPWPSRAPTRTSTGSWIRPLPNRIEVISPTSTESPGTGRRSPIGFDSESVRSTTAAVGAPAQLRLIAGTLLTVVVNHE